MAHGPATGYASRSTTGRQIQRMRLTAVVAGLVLTAGLAPGVPVTILKDTFTDSERLTQNLPTSAHWYSGERSGYFAPSVPARFR